jgi:hypothetical protein
MIVFKFKSDAKGDIYKQDFFELNQFDLGSPDSKKQVTLKLLKPKGAYIKTLTFSLNKTVKNVELETGKSVKTGPFPLVVGKNLVSFDAHSDQPDEMHELEVIPMLLN